MSLSENLYNLGALMKTNLEEKGIDGLTGNEGLTTLANKILDVEPSVAGLELSTSIDCNVSSNEVVLGQSVVFSATLSANYDDTSIEDIDISGVLTGATVLFKKSDGTIIGSGVTDVNGVATYTHTFKAISNITVYSEFEGSTNFGSCISSTTVTVECNYDFDVTVDKEILSANDNDVATFNCRLSDGTGGVFGEPINYQILHNDTVLSSGSKDTNANGEITLEYAATGVGNVDVIFSYGALLQETYELEDNYWYDDATTDKSNSFVTLTGQNPTIIHNTDHYTLTGDSNGNNFIYIGTEEYNNVSYEVTLKLNTWGVGISISGDNGWGTNTLLAYRAGDGQIWFYYSNTGQLIDIVRRTGIMQQGTYYKMILTISDNQYTHRIEDMNGNVLLSSQTTQSLPKKRLAIGLMDSRGSCDVKEIKVRAL